MVDTAVLGHLDSPVYLAGVALGGALFSVLFMGMNFLRMGTTGIAAQAFGRSDAVALRTALWQALIVAFAIACCMIAAQHWIGRSAWYLFDGSAAAESEAAIYFSIRIWSAPATLANFVLIGWFIALQRARIPLLIVVTTNIVNIILDLVLVVGLGWQTAGVAFATLPGELCGFAVGLYCVRRELRHWPGNVARESLTRPGRYRQFFSVNTNILIRTLALTGTLAFMTAQGARFGETVLAANAILMNLQYLLSYGLDGLAHAAEALVGKASGERSREVMARAVQLTLRWSLLIAAVFSATFLVFGPALIGLLTDIDTVREATRTYLPWLILSPLVSVFSFVYDGVFVGATWSRDMRNLMLGCSLLVFMPLWWLTLPLGNHGLWLTFTLFMAARGISMGGTYHYRLRQPNLFRAQPT